MIIDIIYQVLLLSIENRKTSMKHELLNVWNYYDYYYYYYYYYYYD